MRRLWDILLWPWRLVSGLWGKTLGKLHLGLYILFTLMMGFGSLTGAFFERYSFLDVGLLRAEVEKSLAAKAEGRDYKPPDGVLDKIFKPLKLNKVTNYVYNHGKWEKRVTYREQQPFGFYFLLLVIWLWPLYRHHFSKKPQDLVRIEKRIINLPLVIFLLVWAVALRNFFARVAAYAAQYGAPTGRVKLVFAVSSLLVGTLAGYLNLELTGLYIRRFIAQPFFMENNPYGVKRGFAISMTLRYALMMFCLGLVPLLLCVYVPSYFNMDVVWKLRDIAKAGKDLQIMEALYQYHNVLVPCVIVACIAAVLSVFQAISILLFRQNVQEPVNALVGRMRAVAAGDFTCKTSALYADEIGQLKGHFNLMLDGLVEREKIKDTFGKYVSIEIAEKIMRSGKVNLAGEEIQATVLFSDIRDFTPLSEKLPPSELILFLNAYFSRITRPIMDHQGVINKFIGDAVMAVFSPVFGVARHQEAALKAALGMREALKEFNAAGRHPAVAFGVGIHSGGLVAGNVGTEDRLEYTVLGDTVNVASRIESQTKKEATQILVSEAVLGGVDKGAFPGVSFVECAPVLMKGKSKPMVLFKVQ